MNPSLTLGFAAFVLVMGTASGTAITSCGGENMPAYWVAQYQVLDQAKVDTYAAAADTILAKYGARTLFYGPAVRHLEGPEPKGKIVIVEFPSREQAEAAWEDSDYQAARTERLGALEIQMSIFRRHVIPFKQRVGGSIPPRGASRNPSV